MNVIFKPYLRKCIIVFFYDISVYNKDEEQYIQHLQVTLATLRQHQLFAEMAKCRFGSHEVTY